MAAPGSAEFYRNCFEDQTDTDLRIECGGEVFHVHKAIVCQMEYFANACNPCFIEGKTGVITLLEDDSELVSRLLAWIYWGEYYPMPGRASTSVISGKRIYRDSCLFVLAEKYGVLDLKDRIIGKWASRSLVDFTTGDEALWFLNAANKIFAETPESEVKVRRFFLNYLLKYAKQFFLLEKNENAKVNKESLCQGLAQALLVEHLKFVQARGRVMDLDRVLGSFEPW